MIEYFAADELWEPFKTELCTWIGTPYRHFSAEKGVGADCALFINSVFVSVGIVAKVDYKYHSRFWFLFDNQEIVLTELRNSFKKNLCKNIILETVNGDNLLRGDILTFAMNSVVTNHVAIYIDSETVVDSTRNNGVCLTPLSESYKQKITNIFRLYKEK